MTRKLLVTSALPYANGPIHLGHMVEHIQTDIWVRYMRAQGHDCDYVCADDAHGAPIMLRAEAEGITPEALVERIGGEHQADFDRFGISFDNYHTTHSPENRAMAQAIYRRLDAAGHIRRYMVTQAFDTERGMFLADRYIIGTCPRCGAVDQYGDNCEKCGATYTPGDLIDPRSSLSGNTPELRESEHYFFALEHFHSYLRQWTGGNHLQEQVANKVREWFDAGLRDWDISRDAPYFGFPIPDAPGKFFYVWLDAPIGYMASFWNLLTRRGTKVSSAEDLRPHWNNREIVHFIGKDILYFHTLFWPAMLEGAGYRGPARVFAHGFLTVDGQKMSKSRGTFIEARTYLDHLEPDYLRYYFAAKLGAGIDDIDLNLDDFVQRVNSDLVGKIVNIAARSAGFIARGFDNRLGLSMADEPLYHRFVLTGDEIGRALEAREYSKAVREITTLADLANQYIADRAPWSLAKKDIRDPEIQSICTLALNLFRLLVTYLEPIVPELAQRSCAYLNMDRLDWRNRASPLLNRQVSRFEPLIQRIDPARVTAMQNASMKR